MHNASATRRIGRLALVAMIVGFLALSGLFAGQALAEETHDNEHEGRIESRPDGKEGEWKIGGRSFQGMDDTEVLEDAGPLEMKTCVELRYEVEDDTAYLIKIRSRDDSKCDSDDGDNDDGDSDDGDSDDGDSDDGDNDDGDNDDGDSDDGDNDDGDSDDGDNDDGDDLGNISGRLYGILEKIDNSGDDTVYVIDGMKYLILQRTQLEREHGRFYEGACVKVKYVETDAGRVAKEVETERAYKCGANGDDDTPDDDDNDVFEGELFGIVLEIPDGRIGPWRIGGLTVEVTPQTQIDEEDGAIAKGAIVKVHFSTDAEGVHTAREIEVRIAAPDGVGDDNDDDDGDSKGDDDDKPGHHHRWIYHARGHTYGQIESFPSGTMGPIGKWSIGGNAYLANERTKFLQVNGLFAKEKWVLVKYQLDQDGNRIARVVMTIDGSRFDGQIVRLYGLVDIMPDPTDDGDRNFVGPWVVGNVDMVADENTDFLEVNGLLGEGAFVGVQYQVMADKTNYILAIKTLVPPGAGEHTRRGRIHRVGGEDVVAAAATAGADATWVIDGQSYLVTEATDLDDTAGPLQVDANVVVNSYVDADGVEVATQILALGENKVFLPFAVNR